MRKQIRKPIHPGVILDEHYIVPLNLNLQKLADHLGIARNTLFKLRKGKAHVTPFIAIALAETFDTTAQFWLNLQQKYDLWIEENETIHEPIEPLLRNGKLTPLHHNIVMVNRAAA